MKDVKLPETIVVLKLNTGRFSYLNFYNGKLLNPQQTYFVFEMVFKKKKREGYYVRTTPLYWYPREDFSLLSSDVVVISKNKVKADKLLREYKTKAREYKKVRRRYLDKNKGVIKMIFEHKKVLAVLLRGDLVDKNRFLTKNHYTDIDILLLTKDLTEKEAQKLVGITPKPYGLDYYHINLKNKSFHGDDEIFGDTKKNFPIVYDVLDFYKIRKMKPHSSSVSIVGPYEIENIAKSEVLFDKKDYAKQFLNMLEGN